MRRVVVHPDPEVLAEAVAARFLLAVLDAQAVRETVHLVLTGGGIGTAALFAAADSPILSAIDWRGVHLWWGDERFLPTGHPDRNETQARASLIDQFDIPAENVHPIPAPGSDGVATPDDAAAAYAADLARHARAGEPVPNFDLVMLGLGPDAHIASLFPGSPALHVRDHSVVGVTDAPKPPPERVTLTLPALNAARAVWIVAAGAEKANAVHATLAGMAVGTAPAAHVHGAELTLVLIDAAAAASA